MAKATKTMKQAFSYRPVHVAWFAATHTLFNQVAAFYFAVIQAHPDVLNLSNKDALSALEHLTHVTKEHPHRTCSMNRSKLYASSLVCHEPRLKHGGLSQDASCDKQSFFIEWGRL